MAIFAIVCGFAFVVFVWQLPAAVRFATSAPGEFWAVAALAIVIDWPLFMDQRDNVRVRSTLSVCVCFAIFLLYGGAPAIIVQAIAATVTAIGQRYMLLDNLFFACRVVTALAVTVIVSNLTGPHPQLTQGDAITRGDILWFLQLAAVWFVLREAMLIVPAELMSRQGLRQESGPLRYDVLWSATSVLLVTPLLITLPAWWNLVMALPMLAWNLALRERIHRERVLRRDPVTGLQNRRGLMAYMDTLVLRDLVFGRRFAVAVVNAAGALPAVIRVLGRDVYDQVVVEFARRLRDTYGEDRVGRLSGEGFVILLTDLVTHDPAVAGEESARLLSQPMEANGIPFSFNCSAGVAVAPDDGRDLDTLLVKAEYAISEAYREGRPVVVYMPATASVSRHHTALLAELYAVLRDPSRRDEITLLYQPQVDLSTGRLDGVEALLRWTHPEWGLVPTEDLIAAIEPSEVMHLLTRRVLSIAAAQVRTWNDDGFPVRIAVNASVQDLHQEVFADEVAAAIRTHGIRPDQLTIEITERMMITESMRIARAAARITALGVGLSVDDFGTGYASMQQLRLLPLTEVKIDRSYVAKMLTNPAERAIVTSVHDLACAIGVRVVAEGVEDAQTAAALAALDGTVGQGWYFGRPMTAQEVYAQWHVPERR